MRLVAKVRPSSERNTHWDDEPGDDENVSEESAATLVEIVKQNEEIFLLRLNSAGICIGDTWHADIDAAKAQASFEYEIKEADWVLLVMRN